MNQFFKYAIIALVPILIGLISYKKGYQSGYATKSQEVAEATVKQLTNDVISFNVKSSEMEKENLEFSEKLEKRKENEKDVYREVIKYVEKSDRSINTIDSDWVRIYNKSISGSETRTEGEK